MSKSVKISAANTQTLLTQAQLAKGSNLIAVQPGSVVNIADVAAGIRSGHVKGKQTGRDLVLTFSDDSGVEVVLQNFYNEAGAPVAELLLSNSEGVVGSLVPVDGSNFSALNAQGWTDLIVTKEAGINWSPLVALAGIGAVALAANGSEDPPVTRVSGNVGAGPVINGNGLVVDLYDAQGKLIRSGVDVDDNGNFSVTLNGAYPVVIAILRDTNEQPDYRDEVTGANTDLTATLMALGSGVTNGVTTTVQLNINPATTIAARVAGLTENGQFPAGGLTAAQVNTANSTVAETFGLSSLQNTAPTYIFDNAFDDTDGNVSEAEKYGQVLAMLSGLDQKNQGEGGIEKTIADLTQAIKAEEDVAVNNLLLQGAVEFELKNEGKTENEANLLKSPIFDLEGAPESEEDGTPVEPQVTNLLDDIVENAGDNISSVQELQALLDTANAVQDLAALPLQESTLAEFKQRLNEEALTDIGLTGLAAPSPYLEAFLIEVARAANDGTGTDSVAKLQALLDGVIAEQLTPTITSTGNGDGTLTVTGQTTPGAQVTVKFPDGTSAVVTADATGSYSTTSPTVQASGDVEVTALDAAGNTSDPTAAGFSDETDPLAPTTEPVTVNSDGTLSVSGTGEPGSVASVTFPDGTTGTALVGADGSYGPITSAAPQTDGDVVVTQTDAAGNTSPASTTTYADTTDPLAPTTEPVTVNSDGTLSVSGTGEPGSVASVTFPDGTTGTALVGADGSYGPITSAAPQTDGDVVVTQTDAAGNTSPASTTTYADTTDPLAPTTEPVTVNSDGTLSVSGTGEPGSVASVTFPDGTTGTALVGADGSYGPITSAAPQTDGDVVVTQTDAAGNTSPASTTTYADTTDPLAPTTEPVTVNSDGTLSVSGTGEPGSVASVTFPDGTTGTALVGADGSYGPITSAAPQTDGDVVVTQTDAAGNTSPASTTTYADTTDPLAPTTEPVTVNSDGTLSVSGTGEPGSVASVTFPDGTTGTALVGADGSYGPITSAAPQTDGDVVVTQTDAAGNTSPASTTTYADTTDPLAPTTEPVTVNSDGTLSVSGTGEPGSVASVTFPDGTTGTALVGADGSYGPITSAAPQTDGDVVVTQTDAAGNTSPASTTTYADTTDPLAPTTEPVTVNSDGTLSVSGTGEPGSVASVTFPDGTTGTALVGADGSYGPITSAAPQTDGDVVVTQTDAAGNTSPASTTTYADTTDPLAPTTEPVTVNSDGTLSVSGTGEPGSVASVTFPDGTTGTALVGADGSYGPITSAAPQTDGDVVVTQTDAAGNTSPASTTTYADTTDPLAPTTEPVTVNSDGTLSVSGTGEPGSVASVTFPDGTTGTALVGADGSYGPITSAAPQTDGDVVVTQTDAAGNTSPASTTTYADTTDPLAPTTEPVTVNSDGTLSVSGTGEPGSVASVTFPDGTTGTALVGADGSYGPITSAAPQTDGDVVVTQTDAAGNTSPASTTTYADTTDPLAPTTEPVTVNSDGTLSVSGTGEPGSVASVTFPDGTTGTALVGADGSYGPITSAAPQTDGDVVVTQTDAAGNTSPASTTTYADTTDPLAPTTEPVTVNSDGTLSVSGTGEPGSVASVTFPDGTTGTALVGADGSYGPITSAAPQTDGDVVVTQTDAAGNTSPASTTTYADTTDPLAPTTEPVTVNSDGTLSVSGTGEPGSVASVTFPDGTTGTALVGADGSYGPITSAAPQTDGDVVVTQTDAAGNTSPASTTTYADTTDPLAPTTEPVTVNSDGTLSVSGTGEPGSVASVTFPDGTTGTALVGADGSYGPITSAAPQTDGDVVVTQTDAAGNTSPASTTTYADTTDPLAPTQAITANPNGTLSVSGTGEPGSTARVTFPDGTTGTALVGANGSYGPITSTAPQSSGNVAVTQTDAAGNTSLAASSAYTDSTVPLAPTQAITANPNGTLSVSGTGEPGSTARVTFPDGTTGTALVGANGSYGPITSTAPQSSGNVAVTQTDAAGNTSLAASSAYTDSTVPLAPTQAITANPNGTLSVSGTGEPGSTASVTFPDGTTGTALVGANGSYGPITSTAPQSSGNVAVTQTDAAGNTSLAASSAYTDSTVPLAPTQAITANPNGTLSVSGTGEPGSTARVTFPDGTTGTALVGANGSYGPITSTAPQSSGNVAVTQTDAAGNTSLAASSAYTDSTVPLAPTQAITANPNGTLSVSGTGEPGSTARVTFPDGTTGTALVGANGSYGPITSTAPQSSGNVAVTQTDAAGNTSLAASSAYTDSTVPLAPTQAITANPNGTLSVSGTGEPGSTASVTFPDGTTGTALVGANGSYGPITSTAPQSSGNVAVTQTDAAGNTSLAASSAYTDSTVPLAPTQAITANPNGTLSVSGTGEPGSTARVTFPDGTTGTALVGANGSYGPITSTAPQSSGNVAVTQTDAAGNTSLAASSAYTDSTVPLAPVASSTMNSTTGVITTTGTAEPGSTVSVTFPDGTTGTTTAAENGSFTVTSGPNQPSGNVATTATDVAGNGPSTADTDSIVENKPPAAPTVNVGITDQANTVSGTGEAGATVTVRNGTTTVGTTVVWTDGTWSFVSPTAIANGANLTATQTDRAGNTSVASAVVTTFTDTDGDGIVNSTDTDDDGDAITDVAELDAESTIVTSTTVTPAVATVNGAVSTGYSSIVDNSTATTVNIVATAPRENVSSPGLGSIANFFFDFNTVATERLENVSININVNSFDDGIYVAINGTTIVQFNELAWLQVSGGNNLVNTTFGQTSTNFGTSLRWQPWFGNGDPAFRIDLTAGTVQLLVTNVNGQRQDILPFIRDLGVQNPTPNPVPTIDPEIGVTISTASSNVNGPGFIEVQTVTVSGQFAGLGDIDGDGITNTLDIDTDGDRIWDKYEDTTSSADTDGVADYRDTDSNGATPGTDTSVASLTATQVTQWQQGATYPGGYIIMSNAQSLDFTQIDEGVFTNKIEYIDMNDGANAQTLTVRLVDVLAMTDADKELIIVGDANDTVNATGFVNTGKDQSIQGQTFSIYEAGTGANTATLLIDDRINNVIL